MAETFDYGDGTMMCRIFFAFCDIINSGTHYEKNEVTVRSSAAEYLTFIASTGDNPQSIEVRYEDENIWLTQKALAALYEVEVPTINYHMRQGFGVIADRLRIIKKFDKKNVV